MDEYIGSVVPWGDFYSVVISYGSTVVARFSAKDQTTARQIRDDIVGQLRTVDRRLRVG